MRALVIQLPALGVAVEYLPAEPSVDAPASWELLGDADALAARLDCDTAAAVALALDAAREACARTGLSL